MAKILLIEDDLFLRDIYMDFMKGAGFEVVTALDGVEGVEKIKLGGWDLVLVDDNLPKMMGIDVLREGRAIQPAPAKKFLFLTNEQEPTDINDDRLKLSDAYLVKSEFSPEQLIDKIKEFIAS
jgi:two-component system chemotaxis response regulator CheY